MLLIVCQIKTRIRNQFSLLITGRTSPHALRVIWRRKVKYKNIVKIVFQSICNRISLAHPTTVVRLKAVLFHVPKSHSSKRWLTRIIAHVYGGRRGKDNSADSTHFILTAGGDDRRISSSLITRQRTTTRSARTSKT